MTRTRASKRALSILEKCLSVSDSISIPQMNQIQSYLTVSGEILDPYAAGKLLSFFTTFDPEHAHRLFHTLPHGYRTTFIWNTMFRSLVESDKPDVALTLYRTMLAETPSLPNNYTFSFLFTACARLSNAFYGETYHSQAIKLGWESYDFVQNGLIHLYAICSLPELARKIFNVSAYRDVITWTALINGYVKAGQVDVARKLFDEMPNRNAVSWSTMITGYVQAGLFREALELFNAMQTSLRPNHAGIVGAITACAFLGALDQGRWIHAYVDRLGMGLDRILGASLIDMYAKCGCLETACSVFEEMRERDVFAFTSLISAQANHGHSEDAIDLFMQMQKEGVAPNEVTFICVLNACSRMGLVDQGLRIFRSIHETYGMEPRVQHYGCLVDLLGRAGMLEEARNVVKTMPMEPDSYVLGALLNACKVHGNIELGRQMVESLIHRKLDHGGVHVLLSNIYASTNQWNDVARVRKGMEEKKVRKVPGCSSIEVNGVVYEFVAADKSHIFMEEIVTWLSAIDKHLKSLDLDEEEEEERTE